MAQKTNQNLTTAQEHALGVYVKFSEKHGVPPSVRQFAAALGVGPTAAYAMIQRLREKGRLALRPVTEMRLKVTAKGRRDL